MKATIITIGDEILIGQIVDTNSGFIAKSLDRIGVETIEIIFWILSHNFKIKLMLSLLPED